jgi:hypothetical protein
MLEFLSRLSENGKLEVVDQAKERCSDVCASLESILSQPFAEDYDLIADARADVGDKN